MDNDTIEGVVQKQIANPRVIEEGASNYEQVYMPANLVRARTRRTSRPTSPASPAFPASSRRRSVTPADIFAEKCAQCHGLEPGTGSGVGPNLGDSLKGKDAKFILEQIVDPNSDIFEGYPEGVMPQDFEDQIPMDKLNELVEYLLQNANGGG